jgi:hypothetical protein
MTGKPVLTLVLWPAAVSAYAGDEHTAFLNAEYEITNRIAKLWLRDYGTLAARLSEQHPGNTPARQPAGELLSLA